MEAELESEPEFDLSGDWSGEIHDSGDFGVPLNAVAITKVSLIQIGNKLIGFGSFSPTCFDNEAECLKMGAVTGLINGNDISFGIVIDKDTVISYSGTVSIEQRSLNLIVPSVFSGDDS